MFFLEDDIDVVGDSDEEIDVEGEEEAEASIVNIQSENLFAFDEVDVDFVGGSDEEIEEVEESRRQNGERSAAWERVKTLVSTLNHQKRKVHKASRAASFETEAAEDIAKHLEHILEKLDGVVARNPNLYRNPERQLH